MKTLLIAAVMVAFMGSSVAFAEEVAVPAQETAQSSETTVSAFQGVETVSVSSEEMKTAAGMSRIAGAM